MKTSIAFDPDAASEAVKALQSEPSTDSLWNAVVAFQGYPFYTASGLPFSYTIKTGRNGSYNKELIIDRREQSKTLTWASFRTAFAISQQMVGQVIPRPKALADIRGISYIYPIFWKFGLIEVPEDTAAAMVNGKSE